MAAVRIADLPDEELFEFLTRDRQDMSIEIADAAPEPGRYQATANADIAERLERIVNEGFADDEAGEADGPIGHVARVGRFIVRTDGQGFVTYDEHDTVLVAVQRFATLEDELADADDLPTGCFYCLERIAGRTQSLCPSHGDEWDAR